MGGTLPDPEAMAVATAVNDTLRFDHGIDGPLPHPLREEYVPRVLTDLEQRGWYLTKPGDDNIIVLVPRGHECVWWPNVGDPEAQRMLHTTTVLAHAEPEEAARIARYLAARFAPEGTP